MPRKATPVDVETAVLLKSARRCSLCFLLKSDWSEKIGQIAHLDKNPSNSSEDNLAFLCLEHHTQFDSTASQHKNYTASEIKAARANLHKAMEDRQSRPTTDATISDSLNLPIHGVHSFGVDNTEEGWFSLEIPEELHSYIPLQLFIRNCGPRAVRTIRFDPIESRNGLQLWLTGIPNLAPAERIRLEFKAGDNADHVGVVGHAINFFEGGSSSVDQPPYLLTIHFLDGKRKRTEQHVIEGHPLSKGGVKIEVHPILDEKQKRQMAREAIGNIAVQLAQSERDAYDGCNASDYDRLLRQIEQVKRRIRDVAVRYLDSSFESRFLAVNVLDVQLDEPTKLHFISRAQGSFWTVYQQIKGWRTCLNQILQELNRD